MTLKELNNRKHVVVFISGFLTPPNWVSYPSHSVPDDIEMICVYPSPTGSLHDRACQVFYELVGGTVDYGTEHSEYHQHTQHGATYKQGKYPIWNAENPITIIGHSFGGLTAWVLQSYLAQMRFPGHGTTESWVTGIITVNTPLNGVLKVHDKGLDYAMPPIVRWGSPGCVIGWLVHVTEYLDSSLLRRVVNLDQSTFAFQCHRMLQFLTLIKTLINYDLSFYSSVAAGL